MRSSCSSRSCEFLRTGAACEPVRCVPPAEREAKISQYFSISPCSMRLLDMVVAYVGGVVVGGSTLVWRGRGKADVELGAGE